ncbi:MAG: cation diffusion facilitator family transporter [Desulfobacterales bacterium]
MLDRKTSQNRLIWALVINLTFLVVELIGGILANSLALLADAGHMTGDVAALGLALVVGRLAVKSPSEQRTYGLLRAEVLGAFVNGAGLLVITIFIFKEAWERLGTEQPIDGPMMLIIALLGLAANLGSTMVLWKSRKENINIQGAFLHMLADSFGSVGVIAAGIIIWFTGWYIADLVASVCVGVIILWNTWNFIKRSIAILLESTPEDIDYNEVRDSLLSIDHVEHVHDLHIWTITSGMPVLTVHIGLSDECCRRNHWAFCLERAKTLIRERFGISHTTIEIENCETMCPATGCQFEPEKNP